MIDRVAAILSQGLASKNILLKNSYSILFEYFKNSQIRTKLLSNVYMVEWKLCMIVSMIVA